MTRARRTLPTMLLAFSLAFAAFEAALAEEPAANEGDPAAEAAQLVERSDATLTNFLNDPNLAGFRSQLDHARAILIVPALGRGGAIVGGSGGSGVLLARDRATGRWSQPAFYTMGSMSLGLQLGGEVSEVIFVITSNRGVDALMSDKAQLGADMSVAAGPVGTGSRVATADVVSYARSKGAFGGLTVEGSIIVPDDARNAAFYQQSVRPLDILVRGAASNPKAGELVTNLTDHSPKRARAGSAHDA